MKEILNERLVNNSKQEQVKSLKGKFLCYKGHFINLVNYYSKTINLFSEEYRLSYIDIQFRPDTITTMMIFNVYQPSLTHSHLFLQWIHFDSHQMYGLHRKWDYQDTYSSCVFSFRPLKWRPNTYCMAKSSADLFTDGIRGSIMEPPFSFLACFAFILWGKSPRFVSNFSWEARSGDF